MKHPRDASQELCREQYQEDGEIGESGRISGSASLLHSRTMHHVRRLMSIRAHILGNQMALLGRTREQTRMS